MKIIYWIYENNEKWIGMHSGEKHPEIDSAEDEIRINLYQMRRDINLIADMFDDIKTDNTDRLILASLIRLIEVLLHELSHERNDRSG